MDAKTSLRNPSDFIASGLIPPAQAAAAEAASARQPLAIGPALLAAIDAGDIADPIARQFVPSAEELEVSEEEMADPIGDHRHSPIKGIVHRYPDRLLLKPIPVCPVYCRFCFRRENVGPDGETLTPAELETALDYIRARPEIWEVILSGGDPLLLSPRRLRDIVRSLDRIPHVGVIRIHSRVPVAAPERIDGDLIAALEVDDSALYVAIHCNHARELTPAARRACRDLAQAGIPLLAQTVLLKGVNDDAAALDALFRALVRNRVRPYYLHHPDLVRGTGHFRPGLETGQALMRALRGRLSGLCQPTYVLDIPGGYGKAPVGPGYLAKDAGGGWQVEDYCGETHAYPPAPPQAG